MTTDVARSGSAPEPAAVDGEDPREAADGIRAEHDPGGDGADGAGDRAASGSAMDRLRASFTAAVPAMGVYVALRMLSLDVLAVLTSLGHRHEPTRQVYWDGSTGLWRGYQSIVDVLLSWDGRWYSLIAEQGYSDFSSGVDEHGIPYTNRLAFFPLYPYLARPLTLLPGVDGGTACLIISAISALAAAWGMYAIGALLWGKRVGVLIPALWAVAPVSMSQTGAFTESLYTALAVWALYTVLTRRWVAAGLIAGVAGLSRPTAIALVGTVGLFALIAAVRRRDGWGPYATMALAPLGYLAYIWFAGTRLGGGLGGFYKLQRESWDSYFDFGVATSHAFAKTAVSIPPNNQPIFAWTLAVVAVTGLLLVLAFMRRVPAPLLVFSVVMFIGSVGSHAHVPSLGRHLMPIFPALIVPALALARARVRTTVVILVFLALMSGWYGGWLPFASGHVI